MHESVAALHDQAHGWSNDTETHEIKRWVGRRLRFLAVSERPAAWRAQNDVEVDVAPSIEDAFRLVLRERYDLIVCDAASPEDRATLRAELARHAPWLLARLSSEPEARASGSSRG